VLAVLVRLVLEEPPELMVALRVALVGLHLIRLWAVRAVARPAVPVVVVMAGGRHTFRQAEALAVAARLALPLTMTPPLVVILG
jgi:hypothetical protein